MKKKNRPLRPFFARPTDQLVQLITITIIVDVVIVIIIIIIITRIVWMNQPSFTTVKPCSMENAKGHTKSKRNTEKKKCENKGRDESLCMK